MTRTSTELVLPKTFAKLSDRRALRPIQDRDDLHEAQELIDALAVLSKRTRDQEDYLQTLTTLIEKYEHDQAAVDVDGLKPIEILRYLMNGRDMSASDLGRLLGNRELGAAILRGDRQLSKSHIQTLSAHFAVNPALFLKLVDTERETGLRVSGRRSSR